MSWSSSHLKALRKQVLVPLVEVSLTTLERALSTVRNLSNRLVLQEIDELEKEVRGCNSCNLIFSLDIYHLDDEYPFSPIQCPACSSQTEVLGRLPDVMRLPSTQYLTNGLEVLGPYELHDNPSNYLWDWFDTKGKEDATSGSQDSSGNGQEGGTKEAKVLELRPEGEGAKGKDKSPA